jgi:hypothetical protein
MGTIRDRAPEKTELDQPSDNPEADLLRDRIRQAAAVSRRLRALAIAGTIAGFVAIWSALLLVCLATPRPDPLVLLVLCSLLVYGLFTLALAPNPVLALRRRVRCAQLLRQLRLLPPAWREQLLGSLQADASQETCALARRLADELRDDRGLAKAEVKADRNPVPAAPAQAAAPTEMVPAVSPDGRGDEPRPAAEQPQ